MHTRSIQLVRLALPVLLCAALIGGCGNGDSKNFCEDSCAAVVAAGCSNGPVDRADCLQGCGYAQTTCPAEFGTLASCAGSNATFACDYYDSPAPPSCGSENAELQACLQGGEAYCYEVCPAVVAAGCSNGPVDGPDCLDGCNVAATDCATEFNAVAECSGTDATFTCDLADSPVPQYCETENDALQICLSLD